MLPALLADREFSFLYALQGLGAGKAADLTYWESAARMIADVSKSDKIVRACPHFTSTT